MPLEVGTISTEAIEKAKLEILNAICRNALRSRDNFNMRKWICAKGFLPVAMPLEVGTISTSLIH